MPQPDGDTVRRRWRLFLIAEGILLAVAIAATWVAVSIRPAAWFPVPVGILWTWLVCTLPIAILYLLGCPPVITLSPLIPSAATRAFRKELKRRPSLSDSEFHARFYAGSGIAADIPARVRRCLAEFDPLAERAIPADCLLLLDDDLDYADVLHRVGEEFGVGITEADYAAVDGTLDNLVRLVHARRWHEPGE
jgi:hypothetical protein